MIRLSIIIPIYKVEQYLPACLDSAILPGRADYEIIAVDDGSPDRSGQIAEEYAARFPELIRVIHRENGGLGAARNTGIEAARGEYLFFLDSDDTLAPGALAQLLEDAQADDDVVIYDFTHVDEGGRELLYVSGSGGEGRFTLDERPEQLLDPPNACNKLWRRALFLQSGIRFPAGLWYEDLATTPGLCLRAKKLRVVHRPVLRYLQRRGSITDSRTLARNGEIIPAVDLVLDAFRKQGRLEDYYPALEAMAIQHQLLAATVRVNGIDPHAPLQDEILRDMETKFPRWRENAYLPGFPARHRLLLKLIGSRRWGAVHALMAANDLVRGKKP